MIDKHGNKIVPTGYKLTLVSIRRNGKLHSFFVNLPIHKNEKVRIPSCQLNDIAGKHLGCEYHQAYSVG